MALLVLPAGQSLRSLATRLGVPLNELQNHAGVPDADAPLPVDHRVEVPDGFLRSRATARQLKDAVVAKSGRKAGMNTFLALDIEQKRTRAAGGLRAHGAADFELESLEEAWRAYCRFAADSNELALALYNELGLTRSIEIRAKAFAGKACAEAQRARLFGEPGDPIRPQALSTAKAALLADPKSEDAHLAMALALGISNDPAALEEARVELESAVRQNPRAGRCWAEMAHIILRQGVLSEAEAAVGVAMELEPDWLFTLEAAARIADLRGDSEQAVDLLLRATEIAPEHSNSRAHLSLVMGATGHSQRANELAEEARDLAKSDNHRLAIDRLLAHVTLEETVNLSS